MRCAEKWENGVYNQSLDETRVISDKFIKYSLFNLLYIVTETAHLSKKPVRLTKDSLRISVLKNLCVTHCKITYCDLNIFLLESG